MNGYITGLRFVVCSTVVPVVLRSGRGGGLL